MSPWAQNLLFTTASSRRAGERERFWSLFLLLLSCCCGVGTLVAIVFVARGLALHVGATWK